MSALLLINEQDREGQVVLPSLSPDKKHNTVSQYGPLKIERDPCEKISFR